MIAVPCSDCAAPCFGVRCRRCYDAARAMRPVVVCPDCSVQREVSYGFRWRVRTGRDSGRCHPCAVLVQHAATRARSEKACGTCRKTKVLTAFHRCRSHHDGRSSRCADCSRAATKARYTMHRDSIIANARVWALENPERRRAIAREHARRFRRAHPERARQRKNRSDFDAILAEHGLVCHICGDTIAPADLHFDHVVPLSRDGAHSPDNILPSHSRCNLRKGTKLMEELAA